MWIVTSFWTQPGKWEDRVLLPGHRYQLGRYSAKRNRPAPKEPAESDPLLLYWQHPFNGLSRSALSITLGPAPADADSVRPPSLPPQVSPTSRRASQLTRGQSDVDGDPGRLPPLLARQSYHPGDAPELRLSTIPPVSGHTQPVYITSLEQSGLADPSTPNSLVSLPSLAQYEPFRHADKRRIDTGGREVQTLTLGHGTVVMLASEVVMVFRWEPMVFSTPASLPSMPPAWEIQRDLARILGIRLVSWGKDHPMREQACTTCHLVFQAVVTNPSRSQFRQAICLSIPLARDTYFSRCIEHLKRYRKEPNQPWTGWPALASSVPAEGHDACPRGEQEGEEAYDDRPGVKISPQNLQAQCLFDQYLSIPPSKPESEVRDALIRQWHQFCLGSNMTTLHGLSLVWICARAEISDEVGRGNEVTTLRCMGARVFVRTCRPGTSAMEVAGLLIKLQTDHELFQWYDAAQSAASSLPDQDIVPSGASYLPPGGCAVYLDPLLTPESRTVYTEGAKGAQMVVVNQTHFENPSMISLVAGMRMHFHASLNWNLVRPDEETPAATKPTSQPTTVSDPAQDREEARAQTPDSRLPPPNVAQDPLTDPPDTNAPSHGKDQLASEAATQSGKSLPPQRRRRFQDAAALWGVPVTAITPTTQRPEERVPPTPRRRLAARTAKQGIESAWGPSGPSHQTIPTIEENRKVPLKSTHYAQLLKKVKGTREPASDSSNSPRPSSLPPDGQQGIAAIHQGAELGSGVRAQSARPSRDQDNTFEPADGPISGSGTVTRHSASPAELLPSGARGDKALPAADGNSDVRSSPVADKQFFEHFEEARRRVVRDQRHLMQAEDALRRGDKPPGAEALAANSTAARTKARTASRTVNSRSNVGQARDALPNEVEIDLQAWEQLDPDLHQFPPGHYMQIVRFTPPAPIRLASQATEQDKVNVKPFRKQVVAQYRSDGSRIDRPQELGANVRHPASPLMPDPRIVAVDVPRAQAALLDRANDHQHPRDGRRRIQNRDPDAPAQRGDLLDVDTDEEEEDEVVRAFAPSTRRHLARGPLQESRRRSATRAPVSKARRPAWSTLRDESDEEDHVDGAQQNPLPPRRPGRTPARVGETQHMLTQVPRRTGRAAASQLQSQQPQPQSQQSTLPFRSRDAPANHNSRAGQGGTPVAPTPGPGPAQVEQGTVRRRAPTRLLGDDDSTDEEMSAPPPRRPRRA